MRIKLSLLLLIIVIILSSCKKNDDEIVKENDLELINKFTVNVKEPSGLALDLNKGILYTVSDNTNNLYKITKEGTVLHEYDINASDLEGVCLYNSNLLLANERTKQLIKYNVLNGNYTAYSINYTNTSGNSGFEGVTYNSNENIIYVLNEKQPGELLELNSSFVVTNKTKLNFANDYSGIFYESQNNLLWIVSDESSTINKCDINGSLITSYKINVNKCEGIAVDASNGIIYVISDTDSYLYVYRIK